jgi:hypothetical protein
MHAANGHAQKNRAPTAGPPPDPVEVRWPSGVVQQLRNVAADRIVTVKSLSS